MQIKKIKDFDNYYADTEGNVFSVRNNKIIKLYQKLLPTGYLQVHLWKHNKMYNKYVHRLVAETFIPNPKNKKSVNHINGIKTDNRIENLEWLTHSENQIHAYRVLKRKAAWTGKFGKNNASIKIIFQLKDGKIISQFYGASEAERKTGVLHQHIAHCCRGKRKSAGGYQWRYKNKGE